MILQTFNSVAVPHFPTILTFLVDYFQVVPAFCKKAIAGFFNYTFTQFLYFAVAVTIRHCYEHLIDNSVTTHRRLPFLNHSNHFTLNLDAGSASPGIRSSKTSRCTNVQMTMEPSALRHVWERLKEK